MNKSTIIMVIILLGLAYYYWKNQVKTQSASSPDQTELTSLQIPTQKELSDSYGNLIPAEVKPVLSHKQRRQLKKNKK